MTFPFRHADWAGESPHRSFGRMSEQDKPELKPPAHFSDVLTISFFVTRFQTTFFTWNDDALQNQPQQESSNQHEPAAVKDDPTKPHRDGSKVSWIAAIPI